MTITLPDTLAAEVAALVPEEERDSFAVIAVAEAVLARREAHGEKAPCVAAVEAALSDMDAQRGLVPFGDVVRRWEADKAARQTGRS